jgi:(2Fe-2S) ferredoxin
MTLLRCADLSAAAGEEIAGSGVVARRWLCVESSQPWGHDAVETGFPAEVAEWLAALDAKVFAIRRPGRRERRTVLAAETREDGLALRRLELDDVGALPGADPWVDGEPVTGPVFLVCTHGRRDACCSRLGIPVFHALDDLAGPDLVWQCSHTGGHRFAPNVVVIPEGVTLGRIDPALAPEVVALLRDGRVPLASYRGRSLYDAPTQAAEVAVRRAHQLDHLDDLALVASAPGSATFAVAGGGEVQAEVEERTVEVVKSCGAAAEATSAYTVRLA